jgi:hypothetical protein
VRIPQNAREFHNDLNKVRTLAWFLTCYKAELFMRLSQALVAYLTKFPTSKTATDRSTYFKFDVNDLPWNDKVESKEVDDHEQLTLEAAGIKPGPPQLPRRRRRGNARGA